VHIHAKFRSLPLTRLADYVLELETDLGDPTIERHDLRLRHVAESRPESEIRLMLRQVGVAPGGPYRGMRNGRWLLMLEMGDARTVTGHGRTRSHAWLDLMQKILAIASTDFQKKIRRECG
jgi:hypothetical protein